MCHRKTLNHSYFFLSLKCYKIIRGLFSLGRSKLDRLNKQILHHGLTWLGTYPSGAPYVVNGSQLWVFNLGCLTFTLENLASEARTLGLI